MDQPPERMLLNCRSCEHHPTCEVLNAILRDPADPTKARNTPSFTECIESILEVVVRTFHDFCRCPLIICCLQELVCSCQKFGKCIHSRHVPDIFTLKIAMPSFMYSMIFTLAAVLVSVGNAQSAEVCYFVWVELRLVSGE